MDQRFNPILVVDDDPVNCDLLRRMLRRQNREVLISHDGAQALEELRTTPVDLVLLDHRMPGMTGLAVLQEVRRRYSASELPVIMVTAEGDCSAVVNALDLGANDYFTKPVDFRVLTARVRAALSRKQADAAVRDSEQRYALAARGSSDGLWELNSETGELFVRERWPEMLGYTREEISPSLGFWLELMHPDDGTAFQAALQDHCSRKKSNIEIECRVRHKNLSYRWMLVRGMAVWDTGGKAIRVAGSQTDITEAKLTDPLTELPNRLGFGEQVSAAVGESALGDGNASAVLFLRVNGFKLVNDSLGHRAGDMLLIEVAARLRRALRTGYDSVARLGDDKFGLLLRHLRRADDATAIGESLLGEINRTVVLSEQRALPRASLGVALSSTPVADAEEFIHNAETATFAAGTVAAGTEGEEGFAVYDSMMREKALDRLSLESDLRAAVDQREFLLLYQPLVTLATGRITSFEALIRWNHPVRGLVGPNEFIPVAEATGAIVPIGAWVVREAATQLARWRREFPHEINLAVGVNVSPRQLFEPGFREVLAGLIEETRLPARFLELELTEGIFLNSEMATVLESLRGLGVHLRMDDFGTGYSSLAYLKSTRFDALKIDRSFVMTMDSSPESAEIVTTIVGLARARDGSCRRRGGKQTPGGQTQEFGLRHGTGLLLLAAPDRKCGP
jgi:diguanylate cyclase (GGDEF)-like protein/PAS domain S-box-containing protein